jgi:hypothetical protein
MIKIIKKKFRNVSHLTIPAINSCFFVLLILIYAFRNYSYAIDTGIKLGLFLVIFVYLVITGRINSALLFMVLFLTIFLVVGQLTFFVGFRFDSTLIFFICLFSATYFSVLNPINNFNVSLDLIYLHTFLFIIAPFLIFNSFGSKSNLATFLTGWDHAGGHLYVINIIEKQGTFSYFPADYVGSAPKLFHQFTGLFLEPKIPVEESYQIILFFEFFFTYVICLALMNVVFVFFHLESRNLSKLKIFSYMLSISVVPFLGPFFAWTIGFGYPTILLALLIFFCILSIVSSSNLNQIQLRFLPIIFVALIGNTWTPALPGALLIFTIFHILFFRKFSSFIIDSTITFFSILLPSLSIFLNSGLDAASIGSATSSRILTVWFWAGLLFSVYFVVKSRTHFSYFLGGFVLGNLFFAFIVKVSTGGTLVEFPYYSFKLLWISTIPLLLMYLIYLKDFGFDFFKFPIILALFMSFALLSSNYFQFFPESNNGITIIKPTNPNLLWQSEALRVATNVDADLPILIYSESGWDSRSAQFLAVMGKVTWNSQSALSVDIEALCDFAITNPSSMLITPPNLDLPECVSELEKIRI